MMSWIGFLLTLEQMIIGTPLVVETRTRTGQLALPYKVLRPWRASPDLNPLRSWRLISVRSRRLAPAKAS